MFLVQRMAGCLWFDTFIRVRPALVKGTLYQSVLAHHLVGLAAHGLARRMGPASGHGARLPRGALGAVATLLLVPQACSAEQAQRSTSSMGSWAPSLI